MKKLIYYVLNSLLLFNIAKSQEFIKDNETKKVMYKNGLYMVDQYKIPNEKRKFAYEIYRVNENGEKGEFIGDQESEFEAYKKISLASNFYFDKWDMINDLNKIKYLFSETNLAYKSSRMINKLTDKMVQFNVEIALAKNLSRDKVLRIAKDQATEEISNMGKELMNSIIYSYKQDKIKDKKDLEKIVSRTFYNQSTVNTKESLDKLNNIQRYLKLLNNVVVEDMLNFKEDLYSVLYEGYSNRAMQAAEVISKQDIAYKSAFIGDKILENVLFKIENGKKIYDKLKELGLDIDKLDNKISYYINNYVRRDLEILTIMLELQEEQFNPANENSLASKFLKLKKEEDEKIIKNFSFRDVTMGWRYKPCINFEIDNEYVILSALACNFSDSEEDNDPYDANWIYIDLPFNFKNFNKNTKLEFDIEPIISLGYSSLINFGIADHDIPRRVRDEDVFDSDSPRPNTIIHWKAYINRRNNSVDFDYSNSSSIKSINKHRSISHLKKWIVRIITNTNYNKDKQNEFKLKIKNMKIKFE